MEHFTEFRLTDWRFLFNATLTASLIVLMMLNVMPISVLFMIALALGLMVNFPTLKEQKAVIGKHADNVLAVTLLIFAAGIFVGVMSGTGMVKAISTSLVTVIPESAGHFMSVFTAFISMPFTYVLTNDAFYFGILPILAETASHYGIDGKEMAIASLIGQPVHLLSPLVASTYLLCGLLDLDYGDNQRACITWSIGTCVVMFIAAVALGSITVFN